MLKLLGTVIVAALMSSAPAWAEMSGTETYDLLFKNGTLDEVSKDATLVYGRTVSSALKPEMDMRDTGDVLLSFEQADAPMANLRFEQDGKYRNLGAFPASVGNPMIMYFVETMSRDMGEAAGGSLFYIRNRIKDALITPNEAVSGEAEFNGKTIPTTTVTLRPFEGDPNATAMKGFGALEMIVTMSEEVPGWYYKLHAKAPVYDSVLMFKDVVVAQ